MPGLRLKKARACVGPIGRKKFDTGAGGYRSGLKLRNTDNANMIVWCFTENILVVEEAAGTYVNQVIRVGPLSRKMNKYARPL